MYDLSPEEVALLDGDIVVMLADAPADREMVDDDPVLQAVPAVDDGPMVIPDTNTREAMTSNTVLYRVPLLADALARARYRDGGTPNWRRNAAAKALGLA